MRLTLTILAAGALMALPVLAQDNPYQGPPPNSSYGNNGYQNNGYPDHPDYRYPNEVPAGTQIKIRTDHQIEARDQSDGRVYGGTVAEDVMGPDGKLLIPRGAVAELVVANVGPRDMRLDLDSITIRDHRYMVAASTYNRARHEGIGENKHTGEFVGGGALLGTIVGAIAGGGKGAAIGMLAGAGAGAGAEHLTRGNFINIPAESIITFRLQQPLRLGRGEWAHDRGYTRNGVHYHNDYYDQNRNGNYSNSNNYPNSNYQNNNDQNRENRYQNNNRDQDNPYQNNNNYPNNNPPNNYPNNNPPQR